MEHNGLAIKEYQAFLDKMKPGHDLPIPWWKSYRIVKDRWKGFEVQVRYIWFPFWHELGTNTSSSVEDAEKVILHNLCQVVRVYKRLG